MAWWNSTCWPREEQSTRRKGRRSGKRADPDEDRAPSASIHTGVNAIMTSVGACMCRGDALHEERGDRPADCPGAWVDDREGRSRGRGAPGSRQGRMTAGRAGHPAPLGHLAGPGQARPHGP